MSVSPRDYIFFVAMNVQMPDISNRIGALHWEVFHGQGRHPEADLIEEQDPLGFPPIPGITNDYREPLHITRSGVFIPPIFKISRSLVVSQAVFDKIKHLKNIEGVPVVFEKLVDLPMPALGDMSWYTRDLPYADDPDPLHEYEYLEDVPALHQKAGNYYEILGVIRRDLPKDEWELQSVKLNFGRYFSPTSIPAPELSNALLEKYPVISGSRVVLRGDLFAILAPYLDLDYFAIDVISVDQIK